MSLITLEDIVIASAMIVGFFVAMGAATVVILGIWKKFLKLIENKESNKKVVRRSRKKQDTN